MAIGFGREFDDVAIGVAEIDGPNEIMIGNPPGFDACLLAFAHHLQQVIVLHFQGDMQVEVTLLLEVKGGIGLFEKSQEGAICHLVETVQYLAFTPGDGLFDLECQL